MVFYPWELRKLFKNNGDLGTLIVPGYHETHEHDEMFSIFHNIVNPRVKVGEMKSYGNIVVIGVHGWDLFPWISRVFYKEEEAFLSAKFCDFTKNALIHFYREHFPDAEVKITSIALKGHGLIEERVHHYRKTILKNYKKILAEADLIIVAAHSQGVPVAFILFDELIQEKVIIPEKQKIGVISMSGLHHGTRFDPYGLGFIGVMYQRATKELYEMRNHDSRIFKKYIASCKLLLGLGVRIGCFAHYGDSVVDLYSAMMEMFESPSILRALFINQTIYQEIDKKSKLVVEEGEIPDDNTSIFFISLVIFCIKLRNLGYYEHPMFRFLSELNDETSVASHTIIHQEQSVYE